MGNKRGAKSGLTFVDQKKAAETARAAVDMAYRLIKLGEYKQSLMFLDVAEEQIADLRANLPLKQEDTSA